MTTENDGSTQKASSTALAGSENRGVRWRRTLDNPRERAFFEAWEEENKPNQGVGYGTGILQDLFMRPGRFGLAAGGDVERRITAGERMVVATVVQWLGSNVGWCWLERALKRSGWRLVRIKEGDSQNDRTELLNPARKPHNEGA